MNKIRLVENMYDGAKKRNCLYNDGERLQTCIENVTGRFEGKIKINVLKTNIKGPFQ